MSVGSCVSDVFLVVLMSLVCLVGLTSLGGLQLSVVSGEQSHGIFTHQTWDVIRFQKKRWKNCQVLRMMLKNKS